MSNDLSLYDQLREVVATLDMQDQDHFYLLIDQAAFPNIKRRKITLALLPHASVLPSATAFDGASPLLLEIDSLGDDETTQRIVQWLCEQGRWANGLMALRTPLPLPELRKRLNTRTEAILPDNYRVLLRFFDGRILPTLASVLKPAQRMQFLGCVTEWHYADRDGILQAVKDVQFENEDSFDAPLKLDQAQQNALIQASEVDAVIDQLHRHTQFDGTPPEYYRRVAPLVASAKRYGIEDTPHVAMFSMVGLQDGAEFHLQAPWKPLLEQIRDGKLNFPLALEKLEEVQVTGGVN
jgi:hypothetical protein